MPITLFNTYLALNNIEQFSGNEKVMQGTVRLIAAGVTGIAVNDKIFYPKAEGHEVMHNSQEYVLVKYGEIMGVLT